MKVTALIENTHGPGMEHLKIEHGLSLCIEHGGKRILFDTGESGAFADNAIQLGVDLQTIDFVFAGCAHQGILNMVQAVTKAFPGCSIKSVFGGFHLMAMPPFNFMSGSKEEVSQVGKKLLEFPVNRVYTCHCTGSHAFPVLKGAMGDKLECIGTGRSVTV